MAWPRPLQTCALVAVLAGASLLSACATFIEPPAVVQPAGSNATFHPTIELDGRLSARYQQNGHDESLQISFHWIQTPQGVEVTLRSPLNQTLATISVTPTEARLTEAGKPTRTAPDLDSLSMQSFGWVLPVAGLRGWLQGFTTDGGKLRAIATPGLPNGPAVATADGWKLFYVTWQQEEGSGEVRPRRIDLQRYTPELGEMAIRIVLDSWQVP
jgi:outer membrane lipoprotein LolB